MRINLLSPDGENAAARDVLTIVLRYLLETSKTEPAKLNQLLAQQVGRTNAEEIMTTAERLRREGRREGEARGQILGKQAMLLRQLRQRFGSVPAATVTRVDKASAAELDTWADRVLSAESLDAVLGTRTRRKA